MSSKVRILAIGYAQLGFGFGRVLHSLLSQLTSQYEIHQFELSAANGTDWLWTVHPNQIVGDHLGLHQLRSLVAKIQPQLVLLLGELWTVTHHVQLLRDYLPQVKLVAYCPVDGPLQNYGYLYGLQGLSKLVLYNKFAQRMVTSAFDNLKQEKLQGYIPSITVIPHGVNTTCFCPYSSAGNFGGRQKAREKLWQDQQDLINGFIVLNANRNQPRKRIDLTLKGFSLFAMDKPTNVKLYLHMGIKDEGWNVLGLAKTYGILDWILLTTHSYEHPQVSDVTLNCIYNACDVGINTSGGEGWGLCSFEHAATGAAQIVPKHTACQELWTGSAMLIELNRSLLNPYALIQMEEVCVHSVSRQLEHCYQDRLLLQDMSVAAFEKATRPEFRWESVAACFDTLFQEIVCN